MLNFSYTRTLHWSSLQTETLWKQNSDTKDSEPEYSDIMNATTSLFIGRHKFTQ